MSLREFGEFRKEFRRSRQRGMSIAWRRLELFKSRNVIGRYPRPVIVSIALALALSWALVAGKFQDGASVGIKLAC